MSVTESHPDVLEVRGVTKRFGGTIALDGVDLTVKAGEVLGLLGENGSGKSSLIKVLAGFHAPDNGTLRVGGRPVPLPLGGGAAREAGFEFVHQDLGLVESLSVLENLRVPELTRRRLLISWSRERARAREVFERYGVDLDPDATVAQIRPVDRALLAIVRAVEGMRASQERDGGGGLLVLDEPTVFLPGEEVDQLFDLVREIASRGAGVLFVSHDIDEVLALTDRVTVLRDGRVVSTVETAETDEADLVERIIGRPAAALATAAGASAAPVDRGQTLMHVSELCVGPLESVSFAVQEGEVLGVTGLLGSGFERLPYALCGADPGATGVLELGADRFELDSLTPGAAVRAGIATIPADRKNDAAVASLSVLDNILLPTLDRYRRLGVLRGTAMRRRAAELVADLDIRPARGSAVFDTLSGGNQQKAVLAKWLEINPRLLILHEPTQGVDVGARAQIYQVLRSQLTRERAILCASSDHEQLAMLCDRVLVLGRGGIVAELVGEDLTRETVTETCLTSTAGRRTSVGAVAES